LLGRVAAIIGLVLPGFITIKSWEIISVCFDSPFIVAVIYNSALWLPWVNVLLIEIVVGILLVVTV